MNVRVLQISRSVIDGGFDYHREISQAFNDAEFEVTTVFLRGRLSQQRADSYYGSVHCLDARSHRIFKNITAVVIWLMMLARGKAFDLVIAHHQTPAIIVNRLRRFLDFRRMYCLVHDFDYFNAAEIHGRRRNAYVERRLDGRCRFIAVSHAIRDNVLETMPFLDPDRCLVIHNAIDAGVLDNARLDRQDARRQLDIETGNFVFGTVGRLVAFKDVSKGEITRWLWDFGDGNTSAEQHPLYSFESPGEKIVSLTVESPEGRDRFIRVWDIVLE